MDKTGPSEANSRWMDIVVAGCVMITPPLALTSEDNDRLLDGSDATSLHGQGTPDDATIALWLFDETSYLNTTLLDAGPHHNDLRLGDRQADSMAVGRFGNALNAAASHKVFYAKEPLYTGTYPNASGDKVPEAFNLGYLNWTIEFWFKAGGEQTTNGTVLQVTSTPTTFVPAASFALVLAAGRAQWILERPYLGNLAIPTDAATLGDGGWHHVAIVYQARQRQVRHFLDGGLQPLPEAGHMVGLHGPMADVRIGMQVQGWLDEFRISSVARYDAPFTPASLARPPQSPAIPSGPTPLFGQEAPDRARPPLLGSRKHLFIDDRLVASQTGVQFLVNPPHASAVTDFCCDQPGDATPRFGSGVPDILSIWDDGDEIGMIYTSGGMWGGKPHLLYLARSRDGLHWTKPNLGVVAWEGSLKNNIIMVDASQGSVIRDSNPACRPEHRYKYLAYGMNRGIYLCTSPDAVHWRRNETLALPFDCGGGAELFWDDQRGLYGGFFRHEGFMAGDATGGGGRACALAQTTDVLHPWPFQSSANPRVRREAFTLPTLTTELPVPIKANDFGEPYRSKMVKYTGAPDTYLAFPWRYKPAGNVRPGCDLTVSRDGENWTSAGGIYLSNDITVEGRPVVEALTEDGLVRRGDALWQFATVRFTAHGGAAYNGTEYEGGIHDRLLRLEQRLDGFVRVFAGPAGGSLLTKPLVFAGRRLEINADAMGGTLRVGLQEANGKAIAGYAIETCIPITTDAVRHRVAWANGSDVSALAGRPIQIRFELSNANVFAFQFTE